MYDLVVVGSGLFGLTVAESAARLWDARVAIVEKRSHIGGNAYSEVDPETGIEVHKYGAHIFHTSNEEVWNYVRRFTDFNDYVHRVLTTIDGVVYPMPVNLGTINQFFGSAYSPDQARALVREQSSEIPAGRAEDNFETMGISTVGRPLFEAFFRDYTAKQWQTNPTDLPAGIARRLPVRYTYDSRYFSDPHQGLPLDGYAAWFERMVDSPNIDVFLNSDFFDEESSEKATLTRDSTAGRVPVVYTGPVDRFFDYEYGRLGWRTIDFEVERPHTGDYQGCAVMNYGDLTVPETRTIEFRHFNPEREYPGDRTIVYREFSRSATADDDPYYPINTPSDQKMMHDYRRAMADTPGVLFGGRLGTYRYFDMDATIAGALDMVRDDLASLLGSNL
ncbi:UDP-galactopyranose mutase [Actinomycetaceae bacterium MB13-C1-2]|nr:UDP-galactopyranose mutase [Actinomycetaceae bacterium MB13-C1-2]